MKILPLRVQKLSAFLLLRLLVLLVLLDPEMNGLVRALIYGFYRP